MKSSFKKFTSVLLSAMLILTGFSFCPEPASAASSSTGLSVEYRTKEEVTAALKSVWNLDYTGRYSEEPNPESPYSAGKLTQQTEENALAYLNTIRYIAGLSSDVQLKDEYIGEAQAGALINRVNRKLDHYPSKPDGMDDELYNTGYLGTRHGNLVVGTTDFKYAINLLMNDVGVSTAGHRRWILFPSMQYTGFGMVGAYSVMYAHDNFSSANQASNPGVIWPAQNMPLDIFDTDSVWTASFAKSLDISNVTVDISDNNGSSSWSLSASSGDGTLTVDNAGYGQHGCVMFRANSLSYKDGDSYHVVIKDSGNLLAEYDVNFFYAIETPKEDSGSTDAGDSSSDYTYEQDDDNPTATASEIAEMQTLKVDTIRRDLSEDTYWSGWSNEFCVHFSWEPVEKYQTDMYNCYLDGVENDYTTDDFFSDEDNRFHFSLRSNIDDIKRGRGYTLTVCPVFWVNKTHVYGQPTSIKFATKPYKVTGVSAKASKKSGKATISWAKKTGSGYQIQIATNSKFTNGKKAYKVTSSKTLKKTISGLSKGKKYYVRVRAYKTYGNTVYGYWSKVTSFTAK